MQSLVQALLAERESYVRRGLKDRVAQIDQMLRRFNIEVDTKIEVATVAPEVERAVPTKKTKRTAQ